MNKMKALKAFNEGGTEVAVGDEFLVDDEQRFRLMREGKAEYCVDQSPREVVLVEDKPQPFSVTREE